MSSQACEGCRYFHVTDDARQQCRIRPPTVVAHADDEPETVWPRVRRDDWCGQFKPAAAVAPEPVTTWPMAPARSSRSAPHTRS